MKQFLIMFMVLGLVAGSATTVSARKTPQRDERNVESTYDCNMLGVWPLICGGQHIEVDTRPTESFLFAELTDDSGRPVAVDVYKRKPGNRRVGRFCGETAEAIAFPPGTDLTLVIGLGPPPPSCLLGTLPTSGTVTVTLSNLP